MVARLLGIVLVVFLAGGCNSQPSHTLRYGLDYLPNGDNTSFRFERRYADGSFIAGRLTYTFTERTGAGSSTTAYSQVGGTVVTTAGGTATTAKSAALLVPIDQLRPLALDQDWEPNWEDDPPMAPMGLVDLDLVYLRTTRIHVSGDLRVSKLPLSFEWPKLERQVWLGLSERWEDPAKRLAMIWMPDLLYRVGLLQPSLDSEFQLQEIKETPDQLLMTFYITGGQPAYEVALVFKRGQGLVSLAARGYFDETPMIITRQ